MLCILIAQGPAGAVAMSDAGDSSLESKVTHSHGGVRRQDDHGDTVLAEGATKMHAVQSWIARPGVGPAPSPLRARTG